MFTSYAPQRPLLTLATLMSVAVVVTLANVQAVLAMLTGA